MLNILGAPDKVSIEFEFIFPDEVSRGSYIGGGGPIEDGCLQGSPEEVYTIYYPEYAVSHTFSLAYAVCDCYYLGLLPEGMTCRDYFNKYRLPHIEILPLNKE